MELCSAEVLHIMLHNEVTQASTPSIPQATTEGTYCRATPAQMEMGDWLFALTAVEDMLVLE